MAFNPFFIKCAVKPRRLGCGYKAQSFKEEWADICFVPDWAVRSKASYRYLVIREAIKPSKTKSDDELNLPYQTIKLDEVTYKLFVIVMLTLR
jgi:hypothetical protein